MRSAQATQVAIPSPIFEKHLVMISEKNLSQKSCDAIAVLSK
jgi:hypothetical protein